MEYIVIFPERPGSPVAIARLLPSGLKAIPVTIDPPAGNEATFKPDADSKFTMEPLDFARTLPSGRNATIVTLAWDLSFETLDFVLNCIANRDDEQAT